MEMLNTDILGERFINALDAEPVDIQLLVTETAANFMNGCNWAFLSSKAPDYKQKVDFLKNSKVVESYELGGGTLILCDFKVLHPILKRVSPELFTEKALSKALEFRKESTAAFVSFVQSGVKKAKVGIFNLNDSNNITIGGTVYKAFNIDLPQAAMFLERMGYGIVLKGRVLPAGYLLDGDKLSQALKYLELAPSGNALMLDIVKL